MSRRTEIVNGLGAIRHVVTRHHSGRVHAAHRLGASTRDPAVAMLQAHHPVVDARERVGPVVHLRLLDGTGLHVERPAVHVAGLEVLHGPAPHGSVTAHVADHFVAIDVRIERMEHVARIDLEPLHIGVGAHAREDSDACAVVVVPADGRQTLGHVVHVEHDRQVHEDRVIARDHEVVHHGALGSGDGCGVHQIALGIEHVVRDVRCHRAVAEEVQLVGLGAQLGVRGEGGLQLAAEVVATHGLEFGREFPRKVTLFEGPDAAGVREHVRIGGTGRGVEDAIGVHRVEALLELRSAHVAIAVPLRLAAFEANTVHHAVTEEPVASRAALRVRSVAHVQT